MLEERRSAVSPVSVVSLADPSSQPKDSTRRRLVLEGVCWRSSRVLPGSMFRTVIHIPPPTTVALLFTMRFQHMSRYIHSITSTHPPRAQIGKFKEKTEAIFREHAPPHVAAVCLKVVIQYIETERAPNQPTLLSQEYLRASPARIPPACAKNPPPANMSSPPRKIIPMSPRNPPAAANSP